MKVELTAGEKKQLERALESNKIRRWMQQKELMRFEVGDVVIKLLKHRDYQTQEESWKPENINSDTKMAQRYVYVFEDEYGIGYLKRLKLANGKLGQELICLTDFDFNSTRFEVDPEYAEHVLLDAEFDIKKIHKASLVQRKIITKMNRKVGMKPKTLQDFNDFFDKLKVGDTFWTTADFTGRYTQEHKLTKLDKITVSDLNRANSWNWRRYVERLKDKGLPGVNATYAYTFSTANGRNDMLAMEYHHYVFYYTKPAEEEKK